MNLNSFVENIIKLILLFWDFQKYFLITCTLQICRQLTVDFLKYIIVFSLLLLLIFTINSVFNHFKLQHLHLSIDLDAMVKMNICNISFTNNSKVSLCSKQNLFRKKSISPEFIVVTFCQILYSYSLQFFFTFTTIFDADIFSKCGQLGSRNSQDGKFHIPFILLYQNNIYEGVQSFFIFKQLNSTALLWSKSN